MSDKGRFIKQLATFLVGNQVGKSLNLQMGQVSAKEWAALRSTTPLHGYPTEAEAEATLREWLLEVKP